MLQVKEGDVIYVKVRTSQAREAVEKLIEQEDLELVEDELFKMTDEEIEELESRHKYSLAHPQTLVPNDEVKRRMHEIVEQRSAGEKR